MTKHTTLDDARVAEAVGYSHEVWSVFTGKYEWRNKDGSGRIPPFLTAPTYESDGIVLEWVQGQDDVQIAISFYNAVCSNIFSPSEFMDMYKPGQYAQALLEVTEDAG